MGNEDNFKGLVKPHIARKPQETIYASTRRGQGDIVPLIGVEEFPAQSSFAYQCNSKKKTSASVSFGSEDRDRSAKVVCSLQSMNPATPSPGPKYSLQTSFAHDYLGGPCYTFGQSRERVITNEDRIRDRSRMTGPGSHDHRPTFGSQKLSKNKTAASQKFGHSKRDKGSKLYVPGFEHENFSKYTPGPGAHSPKVSIDQGFPTQKKAPSFSFHPVHFSGLGLEKETCGPGRYKQPSAIGSQCLSQKGNQPAFQFGLGPRGEMFKNNTPGSGTYDSNISCVGKQSVSFQKTAPSFGFGTSKRF